MYAENLLEMIELLKKGENDHWAKWFQIAYDFYAKGDISKSYAKVLGAYGGMGSFNDVFWNLPEMDNDRLEYLKKAIWQDAKDNC